MPKELMNTPNKILKKFIKWLRIPTNENNLFDYIEYWDNRYNSNGNSGFGSTGVLAEYKARIINDFVKHNQVNTVIEFGCGDGLQLESSSYPRYLGLDVAKSSIKLCQNKFYNDLTKSFMLYTPQYFTNHGYLSADLIICLDVLYHIIDENDFRKTLIDIFNAAQKYVILYANLKPQPSSSMHIIYRDISKYLEKFPDFQVDQVVEQEYPDLTTAQFIILSKIIK
jgi:hypothetical protein